MLLRRASFIFLLTVFSWVVISLFIKPGYFDPITPSHSDPFRYVVLSQTVWETTSWLTPRPLMIAYLKLIGITGNQSIFFFLLSLPAVLFIAATLITLEFLTKKQLSKLSIFTYLLTVFGSTLFLAISQYDFGGSVAGLLSCLAIIIFKACDEKDSEKFWTNVIIPAIFFWVSIETKPTFAVGFLGAIAAFIILEDFSRRSLYLLAIALMIVASVFAKDAFLGSKFIQMNGSNDVYSVAIDPAKNITLLLFYLRSGFPDVLLTGLIISAAYLAFNRKFLALTSITFISIGAAIPMALLVNRAWDIYGWYTQVIMALMFALAVDLIQENMRKKMSFKTKIFPSFCMFIIVLSSFIYSFKNNPTTTWTVGNQLYNKNVLNSLSYLNSNPGEKYLFSNISGPYHPFKNTKFIKIINPELTNFDVLVRESERAWNDMSHDQNNGVYLSNLTVDEYDKFIILDTKGNIKYQLTKQELLTFSDAATKALLICGNDINQENDALSISNTLDCLNKENLFQASLDIFENLKERQKDFSWLHYHYANALKQKGNIEASNTAIDRAIELEKSNTVFLTLKKSIEEALK